MRFSDVSERSIIPDKNDCTMRVRGGREEGKEGKEMSERGREGGRVHNTYPSLSFSSVSPSLIHRQVSGYDNISHVGKHLIVTSVWKIALTEKQQFWTLTLDFTVPLACALSGTLGKCAVLCRVPIILEIYIDKTICERNCLSPD